MWGVSVRDKKRRLPIPFAKREFVKMAFHFGHDVYQISEYMGLSRPGVLHYKSYAKNSPEPKRAASQMKSQCNPAQYKWR